MEILGNLLICVALLHLAHSQGPCPCVPGGACDSKPYGSLAQDISVLGLFGPCPHHGQVRCCSRAGLENLYDVMLRAAITHESDTGTRIKVRPVASVQQNHPSPSDECGCIPRGICMPHLTRQTAECSGQHELCCINARAQSNVLVNIFSANQAAPRTTTARPFRPQPVFRPNNARKNQEQLGEEDNPADNQGLPCLQAAECSKLYGSDALDIARFGVLSPCTKRGFHRCVEPNIETNTPAPKRPTPTRPPQTTTRAPPAATASTPPHQHRPENVNLVPCVQHHRCIGPLGTFYNSGSGDHLSRFGVLPQCSPGMIRCILEVDLGIFAHMDNINLPIFRSRVSPTFFNDDDNAPPVQEITEDPRKQQFDLASFSRFLNQGEKSATKFPQFQQFATAASPATTQAPPQQLPTNQDGFLTALKLLQSIAAGHNKVEIPTATAALPVGQFQQFQQQTTPATTTAVLELSQQQRFLSFQQQDVESTTQAPPVKHESRMKQFSFPASFRKQNTQTTTQAPPPVKHEKNMKKFRFPSSLRRPSGASVVKVHDTAGRVQGTPASLPEDRFRVQSRRVVHHSSTKQVTPATTATTTAKTTMAKIPRRNFFSTNNRRNIFESRRKNTQSAKKTPPEKEKSPVPKPPDPKTSISDGLKSQFANFEEKASVAEDAAGNLVISGGRHVVHLPPGISPPGQPKPSPPPGAAHIGGVGPSNPSPTAPVFFDPREAPHVIEALRNSKKAVIQVQTDDNQKMVLNVKNDQLLSILQALSAALDVV